MIKRVLLLGDFSALHRNLEEGLRKVGVDAACASYENAWRKLGSTIDFDKNILGLPTKISRNISPFVHYRKLIGNDVVQFVHYTNIFNVRYGINSFLTKKIASHNGKAFLLSTGCDPLTRRFFQSGEYEFPQLCQECLRLDRLPGHECPCDLPAQRIELSEFLKMVNGVIPSSYEYAEAHRRGGTINLMKAIPLPVNTDKVKYSENIVKKKLVVFHGINRVGFKGTELIRSALENVRRKYPNEIEIIIDGKMPLDAYVKLLERTNVVVDQIYGVSYGMNTIYSMALGKVVVGGGHPAGLAEYGLSSSPIIPVHPSIKSIEESIIKLLENRKEIPQVGYDSRMYVENTHNYELVAKKFLSAWESQCLEVRKG